MVIYLSHKYMVSCISFTFLSLVNEYNNILFAKRKKIIFEQFSRLARREYEPSPHLRRVALEGLTTKRAARQDLYLMMTKWCLCLGRTVGADVQVAAKRNKALTPASRLQIDNWTKTESGSIGKTQINRRTIVHSNRHFLRRANKEEMLRGYDN